MKLRGYLLTGGKNSRMGGEIKLFLEMEGQSFGKRILASLKAGMEACDIPAEVYLSVDRPEPYKALGLPMILDEYPAIGPMGGILSGLHQLTECALFVVPSDSPFLTAEAIERLIKDYQKKPVLTIAKVAGKEQPLLSIYPPSVQPLLEKLVEEKCYKMREILKHCSYQSVELEDQRLAKNINTPEDYQELRPIELQKKSRK